MEAVEKIKEVFLMYAKNHVFFGDDVIEGIERLKIGNNIRDLILSYAGVFGRFLFGDKNFIKEYGELLSEFNVFINNYAIRYKSKLNEFSVIIINEKFEKDYLPHEEYIFDCGNIFVYNSNETIVIDGKGYGHIYGNNCAIGNGNAKLHAYDNSQIILKDNSIGVCFNKSGAFGHDDTSITAFDNSTIILYNNSKCECFDFSIVYMYNNSSCISYNDCVIHVNACNSLKAMGFSKVFLENVENFNIKLYDYTMLLSKYNKFNCGQMEINDNAKIHIMK